MKAEGKSKRQMIMSADILKTHIRASIQPFFRDRVCVNFYRLQRNINGQHETAVVRPIKWEVLTPEEEAMNHDPSLQMTVEDAQQLMDELWRCGLRPVEAMGSAGQAAATEKHLQDMRRIAFHKLGIDSKQP